MRTTYDGVKGDISEFVNYYQKIYEKSKGKGYICVPSGNHDMVRQASGKRHRSPLRNRLGSIYTATEIM